MGLRIILLAAWASGLAGCTGPSGLSRDRAEDGIEDFAKQIVLTVHQDSNIAVSLLGAPGQHYPYSRAWGPTPSVERLLNRLAKEHGIARVRGWAIPSIDVYCEVFQIVDDRQIDAVIDTLNADSRIDLAQRMNTFTTMANEYNDPFVDLQAAVKQMDVETAHSVATGDGVVVAVVDSRIDAAHPDLRGRIGVQRDLADRRPTDLGGEVHGTAIAGVIASTANNAEGIIGIAPDARITGLRACWSSAPRAASALCTSFSLAQALELVLELEPDIVNMSLIGPEDPLLGRLIDQAISMGIIVVAPGREGDSAAFPASKAGVFAARAPAPVGDEPSFSFQAPASEVLTTTPDDGYAFFSGNSLAAAHLSGVIALLLEQQPELDFGRLAEILHESLTTRDGIVSVNACRALQIASPQLVCETQ